MKYYEIVRIADCWPEMDEYEKVHKLITRGWLRKALLYLCEWDYGGENLDAARVHGALRDSPLDPGSIKDKVLYRKDDYLLCEANCPSGLYQAYYLVKGVDEKELA